MSPSVSTSHPDSTAPHQVQVDDSVSRGSRGWWQPRPRRRQNDRHWSQNIVPNALESLREHPEFHLESLAEPRLAEAGQCASPHQRLREDDREALLHLELLRIFRSRVRLVTGLGLVILPLFTAFYFFLAPGTSARTVVVSALIMVSLLLCMALTGRIKSLGPMRAVVQFGYLIFCLGNASQIPFLANDIAAGGENSRAALLVASGSFIPILLSVLLLPFTIGETLLTTFIAVGALAMGLSAAKLDADRANVLAQIFVTLTTSFFVLLISHLGCLLRRCAFHSAFDLALQAARMQEISATDGLTGGFNRRHIEALLGAELARANYLGQPTSVLMFDLDNFKAVNDTQGHAAGDEVLREVWHASCAALREVDTLSRFGGDEFLIVLPATGELPARGVADRLRAVVAARLRERWGQKAIEGSVTLSIGVLCVDGRASCDLKTALARVDALLYQAKRDGKNRTVIG